MAQVTLAEAINTYGKCAGHCAQHLTCFNSFKQPTDGSYNYPRFVDEAQLSILCAVQWPGWDYDSRNLKLPGFCFYVGIGGGVVIGGRGQQ